MLTQEALRAAAMLADRFIQDRFLPDKAFDLIDEACANISVRLRCGPEELFRLREERKKLNREIAAFKADPHSGTKYKTQIEKAMARREEDVIQPLNVLKRDLARTVKLRKELLHMMKEGDEVDELLLKLEAEELVQKTKGSLDLTRKKLDLQIRKERLEQAEQLTRELYRLREDRLKLRQDIKALEGRGKAYHEEMCGSKEKLGAIVTRLKDCKKERKDLRGSQGWKQADLEGEDFGRGKALLQQLYQAKTEAKSGDTIGGRAQALSQVRVVKARIAEFRKHAIAVVDAEQIAEVVTRWTGIRLTHLSREESFQYVGLEQQLLTRIVGQDRAVALVVNVRRFLPSSSLCDSLTRILREENRHPPCGIEQSKASCGLPVCRSNRCRKDRTGSGAGGSDLRKR